MEVAISDSTPSLGSWEKMKINVIDIKKTVSEGLSPILSSNRLNFEVRIKERSSETTVFILEIFSGVSMKNYIHLVECVKLSRKI